MQNTLYFLFKCLPRQNNILWWYLTHDNLLRFSQLKKIKLYWRHFSCGIQPIVYLGPQICLIRTTDPFSPTRPSGLSWSSSHRACLFVCPLPVQFFPRLLIGPLIIWSVWGLSLALWSHDHIFARWAIWTIWASWTSWAGWARPGMAKSLSRE